MLNIVSRLVSVWVAKPKFSWLLAFWSPYKKKMIWTKKSLGTWIFALTQRIVGQLGRVSWCPGSFNTTLCSAWGKTFSSSEDRCKMISLILTWRYFNIYIYIPHPTSDVLRRTPVNPILWTVHCATYEYIESTCITKMGERIYLELSSGKENVLSQKRGARTALFPAAWLLWGYLLRQSASFRMYSQVPCTQKWDVWLTSTEPRPLLITQPLQLEVNTALELSS